jgi:hypothetical protein
VWLVSLDYGADNPDDERLLWVLGRPGMTEGAPFGELVPLADGSALIVGESVTRFDGSAFLPDDGPQQRPLGGGATLWMFEPDELMALVEEPDSMEAPEGLLAMIWQRGWRTLGDFRRGTDTRNGGLGRCSGGDGVTCVNDADGWRNSWLEGTSIGDLAVSPDRTIWAVGDYRGDQRGIYRITP